MTGLRAAIVAVIVLGLVAATAAATYASRGHHSEGGKRISIRDDCDGSDTAWNAVGGCTRKHGRVTVAEFDEELDSPRAAAVVGHQAWRNDPPYLVIKQGQSITVKNKGGRGHTLTEVAEFGGGVIPPLNEGLTPSPECANLLELTPGESAKLEALGVGNHRFICCFHPWMRALVKVEPKNKNKHH
jgi:plastocyanin